MKREKLMLSELKVSSFISEPLNVKGGNFRDVMGGSPLCMETEGCQTH
jgi:hypothetical protein